MSKKNVIFEEDESKALSFSDVPFGYSFTERLPSGLERIAVKISSDLAVPLGGHLEYVNMKYSCNQIVKIQGPVEGLVNKDHNDTCDRSIAGTKVDPLDIVEDFNGAHPFHMKIDEDRYIDISTAEHFELADECVRWKRIVGRLKVVDDE